MKTKYITAEDRILWGRVARSTRPMPGKSVEDLEREMEDFATLLDPPAPKPKPRRARSVAGDLVEEKPQQKRQPPAPNVIDRPTHQKIARGRLPIEGKVDLHGMTQSEAHALLLSFLQRAYADGRRHVLVVTGKGSPSRGTGVLRQAVPGWLSTPPFRALVSGHQEAARHHGGEGALYIRLRKREAP